MDIQILDTVNQFDYYTVESFGIPVNFLLLVSLAMLGVFITIVMGIISLIKISDSSKPRKVPWYETWMYVPAGIGISILLLGYALQMGAEDYKPVDLSEKYLAIYETTGEVTSIDKHKSGTIAEGQNLWEIDIEGNNIIVENEPEIEVGDSVRAYTDELKVSEYDPINIDGNIDYADRTHLEVLGNLTVKSE